MVEAFCGGFLASDSCSECQVIYCLDHAEALCAELLPLAVENGIDGCKKGEGYTIYDSRRSDSS